MAGMGGTGGPGGWIDSLKAIIEANPVDEVDEGVGLASKMSQNAAVLSKPFRFSH